MKKILIFNIINIYNKINKENELENTTKSKNEILIKYLIEKDDKEINIFGEEFVENNKDKCKYIYE